jgi:hypothetical protein
MRDGIHPFDLERDTGALALHPRDEHLARHRPAAGVLLDELLSSVADLTFDFSIAASS